MIGVYYLWDGASVVYVGASRNVERRIRQHASRDLDFSGYFVDTCELEKLNELEARAIAEFRPKFNVNANLQA